MENKRTEELRKYKASVKSKLMAAIAMLMVSSILLSSTTYAWFVLSTAPEVKGMATTVGSNGSLEIALLNTETGADTSKITADVGDASVLQGVADANESWGNIVDLSDANHYGMNLVTLYPAGLNMASETNLVDLYEILKTPSYGVDGRVVQLVANTRSAKYTNNTFAASASDWGFRAIGTYTSADPVASALANAKRGYTNAVNAANAAALPDTVASGLTALLLSRALQLAGNDAQGMKIDITNLNAIGDALDRLDNVATGVELAIKNGIAAKYIATNKATINVQSIDLSTYANNSEYSEFHAVITEVGNFRSSITSTRSNYNTVVGAHSEGALYTWDEYGDLLQVIVGNDMKINDKSLTEVQQMTDKLNWASKLTENARMEVNSGLLNQAANMINTFTSTNKFTVVISPDTDPDDGEDTSVNMSNATMTVNCNAEGGASMVVLNTNVVSKFELAGADVGNAQDILNNYYGYVIDLAFRASTNTNLMLTSATQRVGTDAETQGAGATFTLTNGSIADLAALRIVFVDPTNFAILGVAGVSNEPIAEGGKDYAIHMYEYTVDKDDGGITLGAQKTTTPEGAEEAQPYDFVASLTEGNIKKISVVVYLDGNHVASAMDGVTGTLNLQFASSAPLTPMSYSDWVKDEVNGNNTNTYATYEGTVTWTDNENAANARPTQLTIGVYKDGSDQAEKTVTITADEGWAYKFEDLLTKDAEGNTHTYKIKVVGEVANYTFTETDAVDGGITATYSAN